MSAAEPIRILSVFGTRPEAIKMAPVVERLRALPGVDSRICLTGQHRQMLDDVLSAFAITGDYDLDIMRPGQQIGEVFGRVMSALTPILAAFRPHHVLVQGDTATSTAAALAAFFHGAKVGHIEAGLRTGNLYSPWPEEANRCVTAVVASRHYAPTIRARDALIREGRAPQDVVVTGNTVIDALLRVAEQVAEPGPLRSRLERDFAWLHPERRLVLVTGHRRESFGRAFECICEALRILARREDIEIVYPVHLNPNVREPVERLLSGVERVHLIEPQGYQSFVYLMQRSAFLLTDSGGVQEEAPALCKPVLVMRDTSERMEAVEAGLARLVGTDPEAIVREACALLDEPATYDAMARGANPFGDGHAAARIVADLVGHAPPLPDFAPQNAAPAATPPSAEPASLEKTETMNIQTGRAFGSLRILVTGGAGFVGSHLCERLLADGHRVICLDNLQTGRMKNVEHLLAHPKFEFVLHDVTLPFYVPVDQIYNLACPASPVHYQDDPIQTLKTSVLGALHMLGLAKRLGVPILQASTSEIYGDPAVHPQHESYWGSVNPIGPRACYDVGKRAAETLFFDYRRRHGVSVKVVRIFNTYGPRMSLNDGRVVSNFIAQAIRGEDITIFGDGSQTRSFCYVDDLVDGIVRMMATPEAVTGPINLGNPGEFTMRELADIVKELTGSDSAIVHQPLPQDDPRQRRPDIEAARTELGWQPQITLRDGLARMIPGFGEAIRAEATAQPPRTTGAVANGAPASGLVGAVAKAVRGRFLGAGGAPADDGAGKSGLLEKNSVGA